MRRLIRDIGVFRLLNIAGRTQGRTLGVAGGICSWGFFCQAHVCDLLPCLRSRSQFQVEPRMDSPIRVRVSVSLKTIPQVFRTEVWAVFPVDGIALCRQGGRTLLVCPVLPLPYTPLVIIVSI